MDYDDGENNDQFSHITKDVFMGVAEQLPEFTAAGTSTSASNSNSNNSFVRFLTGINCDGEDDDNCGNEDIEYTSTFEKNFTGNSALFANSDETVQSGTNVELPLVIAKQIQTPIPSNPYVAVPAGINFNRANIVIVKKISNASDVMKKLPVAESVILDRQPSTDGHFVNGAFPMIKNWQNRRRRLDKKDPRYLDERCKNNRDVKKCRAKKAEKVQQLKTDHSILSKQNTTLKTMVTYYENSLAQTRQTSLEIEEKNRCLQNELSLVKKEFQAKLNEVENKATALENRLFDVMKESMWLKSILNDHSIPF